LFTFKKKKEKENKPLPEEQTHGNVRLIILVFFAIVYIEKVKTQVKIHVEKYVVCECPWRCTVLFGFLNKVLFSAHDFSTDFFKPGMS